MFGPPVDLKQSEDAMAAHNATLTIHSPERPSESIETKSPLFLAFAYYQYYLLKQKYKGFVKFDMNHPAYFDKRDTLLESVNDPSLSPYWQACIISLVSA